MEEQIKRKRNWVLLIFGLGTLIVGFGGLKNSLNGIFLSEWELPPCICFGIIKQINEF